jgi:hypothetical protein
MLEGKVIAPCHSNDFDIQYLDIIQKMLQSFDNSLPQISTRQPRKAFEKAYFNLQPAFSLANIDLCLKIIQL